MSDEYAWVALATDARTAAWDTTAAAAIMVGALLDAHPESRVLVEGAVAKQGAAFPGAENLQQASEAILAEVDAPMSVIGKRPSDRDLLASSTTKKLAECPVCNGRGWVAIGSDHDYSRACPRCGGSGLAAEPAALEVRVGQLETANAELEAVIEALEKGEMIEHAADCFWRRAVPSVDGDEASCCSCDAVPQRLALWSAVQAARAVLVPLEERETP